MFNVLAILGTFLLSSLLLHQVSKNLPPLNSIRSANDSYGNYSLHFPVDFQDLKETAGVLQLYKEEHSTHLFCLFVLAYLYKQTFAIPGSVFLNILGGALFGFYAFPVVCVLSATGSSFCYFLSKYLGRRYVVKYFPQKVAYFQDKLDNNRESLFYFLLGLRLFPMSPNWLMNLMAPIVNVPIQYFFPSVVFGLAPYNFICVQTGVLLSTFTSLDQVFTGRTLLSMAAIALSALLPGIFLKQRRTPTPPKRTPTPPKSTEIKSQ